MWAEPVNLQYDAFSSLYLFGDWKQSLISRGFNRLLKWLKHIARQIEKKRLGFSTILRSPDVDSQIIQNEVSSRI